MVASYTSNTPKGYGVGGRLRGSGSRIFRVQVVGRLLIVGCLWEGRYYFGDAQSVDKEGARKTQTHGERYFLGAVPIYDINESW